MTREELWAKQLLRSEGYVKKVDQLYLEAIKEAIRIAMGLKYDPNKPFTFSSYPASTERIKRLFAKLAQQVQMIIVTGEKAEWLHANAANDKLVSEVLKTYAIPAKLLQTYRNANLEALAAFQNRKVAGMNLSQRVWNLSQQLKTELELALDVGLGEGRTAQQLSQDVRAYLNEPDKLFRRVRDKRGVLQLSKAAKAYNPGQGVYRSSYKNAMRLTRTEINMAYRDSDHQRWLDMDFIVGFEVKRSNKRYECPLCDAFVGQYPKTYKFIGQHPHCRCYATPILATKAEISAHSEAFLNDEDTPLVSVNEVKRMPQGWLDWIKKNTERINKGKTPPYFIRDNFKKGRITEGLKFAL